MHTPTSIPTPQVVVSWRQDLHRGHSVTLRTSRRPQSKGTGPKKQSGHRGTQRGDHVRTQGKDGIYTSRRGLRNQADRALVLDLQLQNRESCLGRQAVALRPSSGVQRALHAARGEGGGAASQVTAAEHASAGRMADTHMQRQRRWGGHTMACDARDQGRRSSTWARAPGTKQPSVSTPVHAKVTSRVAGSSASSES